MPRRFRPIIAAPIALFVLLGPALGGASGAPAGTPSWLQAVNDYRALGGLAPVTENTTWSEGGVLHSKYMVKTGTISHDEDPGSLWYTAAGAEAAANGNVAVSGTTAWTDVDAVNDWMSGPFHGIGILDPALEQSGFGSYREPGAAPWEAGATLDVIRGLSGDPATSPVMWPGNGATHPLRSYDGNEFPDPLTSCSGLSAPTGPPIYLMLTTTPDVTASSFSRNGAALGHCVFDGTDYENPAQDEEDLGRAVLGGRNAIVLMPEATLSSGATYDVSITSNGQTYAWSFTTGGGPGGTDVNRTITLDLKVGNTIVGKGTVADDAEAIACESSVPVKLQYKKPTGWKTIVSGTTDVDGKYRLTTSIKIGRWRTKAAPTTVGDADCLKALSNAWRVTS